MTDLYAKSLLKSEAKFELNSMIKLKLLRIIPLKFGKHLAKYKSDTLQIILQEIFITELVTENSTFNKFFMKRCFACCRISCFAIFLSLFLFANTSQAAENKPIKSKSDKAKKDVNSAKVTKQTDNLTRTERVFMQSHLSLSFENKRRPSLRLASFVVEENDKSIFLAAIAPLFRAGDKISVRADGKFYKTKLVAIDRFTRIAFLRVDKLANKAEVADEVDTETDAERIVKQNSKSQESSQTVAKALQDLRPLSFSKKDLRVADTLIGGNLYGEQWICKSGRVLGFVNKMGETPLAIYVARVNLPLMTQSIGSAVLRNDGKVAGMTLFANNQHIWVLPAKALRYCWESFRKDGAIRHAWFNIGIEPGGLPIISDIKKNSPGAKAGLQIGDLIQAINGKTTKSSDELMDATYYARPKQAVTFSIWRNDKNLEIEVSPVVDPFFK